MNNCSISSIEYKKFKIQYDNALNEVKKWEASLRNKYSFGDSIVINSMLSYFINIENGFDSYNDENYFQSLKNENDILYNEAKYGAELYKPLIMIGPIVWKRNGYKRR